MRTKGMIILIPFIMLLAYMPHVAAQEDFPSRLKSGISEYYQKYPDFNVFLHTDKSVYFTGETIRFKAILFNPATPSARMKEQLLTVGLMNKEGQIGLSKTLQIGRESAYNILKLPEDFSEGRYFLMALVHNPNQMEDQPVFMNELYILDPRTEFDFMVSMDKQLYAPGDEVILTVNTVDNKGNPQGRVKYEYALMDGDKVIARGKEKSSRKAGQLDFTLPGHIQNNLVYFKLDGEFRNTERGLMIRIPVFGENIQVDFAPEGGHVITGVENKIGVFVHDATRHPFAAKGIIMDDSGNVLTEFKTDENGVGSFYLNPLKGVSYVAMLTGPFDLQKDYPLPSAETEGMALTLMEIDQDSACFLLRGSKTGIETKPFVIAHHQGVIHWLDNPSLAPGQECMVPLENFPPGPSQVSIFNSQGGLLTERMIWIEKNPGFGVTIESGEESFHPGRRAELMLDGSLPGGAERIQTSLSVSHHDFNRLEQHHDILSYFYVGSSLNRNIYTSSLLTGKQADFKSRDNFVLNAGWSMFHWNRIFGEGFATGNPDSEKAGKISPGYLKYRPASLLNVNLMKNVPMQLIEKRPSSYKQALATGVPVLEVMRMIKPFNIIDGNKIVFPTSGRSINQQDGALVVIDGMITPSGLEMIKELNPTEVESVEISTDPMDIQRYSGLNNVGLVEIKTKRGEFDKPEKKEKKKEPIGKFEFGSDLSPEEIRTMDKTTVYWDPSLTITGLPQETQFRLPDIQGEFDVILQGFHQGYPFVTKTSITID